MDKFDLNDIDLKNLAYNIYKKLDVDKDPIFLCVGSDKVVCDSVGPIVAEMLTKKYNIPAYVYGGLDYNINAQNLMQSINYVEITHTNCQIILIDATLGDNVGQIMLGEGSFAALGKVLPIKKIGNFSILGVVNKKTKTFNLNTTKLKVVMDISQFIAKAVAMAVSEYSKRKSKCRHAM